MKITRLRTHWDAEEAYMVIEFLTELNDLLWQTYGDKIIEHQQSLAEAAYLESHQTKLPFDDPIEF